jgi:anti-sigma regulatory factor (Ser/Thr protein kinase)
MDKPFTSYPIEERSFVAYIKREIHNEALQGFFSEKQVGEIDIIISELCSNLIKHAGSGELLYRIFNSSENDSVFEIICFDRGPGMADSKKMMKDGVSTTKTLGQGLGAIERLSNLAQLYSIPGWGTIHYATVSTLKRNPGGKSNDLEIRALCVNKPREIVCGDGFRIKKNETETQIFFGDGLGHGQHAKDAVDRAGDFFLSCKERDPVDILRQMHEVVRRTRGLVGTVAVFDKKKMEWNVCGIGNILSRMYTGIMYKNYMAYNGTIGLNIPTSLSHSAFPAEKNQHLVMCSDGIRTRWDLTRYPSILKQDNTILAAALYKDYSRGNDDSSILIAKVN